MTLPNSPESTRCQGELSVVYTVEMECVVTVDSDGNLVPFGKAEEVDIIDGYSVWCSKHNTILTTSQYQEHGINEYWELL